MSLEDIDDTCNFCRICGEELTVHKRRLLDNMDVMYCVCPRCNQYILARDAAAFLLSHKDDSKLSNKIRLMMSNHIFHDFQHPFIISKTTIQQLLQVNDKDPLTKLDSLLIALYNRQTSYNFNRLSDDNCLSLEAEGWICGQEELLEIFKLLKEIKYIDGQINIADKIDKYRITVDGYKHLKTLVKTASQSQYGFVAMSFRNDLDDFFENGIIPAIREAGFEPQRIDRKEHINKIDDEILVEIKKSRFLVADLTFHRQNVYYEIGFAHALGIPVFFTCREDHEKETHFDVKQYNCIFWEIHQLDIFRKKLTNRIKIVLNI
jgi:nucleoside 2-deoxyribosyltransferase